MAHASGNTNGDDQECTHENGHHVGHHVGGEFVNDIAMVTKCTMSTMCFKTSKR